MRFHSKSSSYHHYACTMPIYNYRVLQHDFYRKQVNAAAAIVLTHGFGDFSFRQTNGS